MNTLTAYRTFGDPGYRPGTARVRIYDARWYLVTLQNTSRDQGDGYYLEDGEHVVLLPGRKAREERDARLNNCNAVREWGGEVWELTDKYKFGLVSYHTSRAEADKAVAESRAEEDNGNREALARCDRLLAKTDAELEAVHSKHYDWDGVATERARAAEEREGVIAAIARYSPRPRTVRRLR